jgi:uncharacterized protein YcaQ
MLEDMVRLYSNHQNPPGAAFVERGDYRLVHGRVGNVIEPARWTYDVKSGHTVEMSIIIRERNQSWLECPRCHSLFKGQAKKGWADWKVSQIDMLEVLFIFFAARLVSDGFELKPGQMWTAWSHQLGELGC